MKNHNVIDAIQELRLEMLMQDLRNSFAHLAIVVFDFPNLARAEIRRHDQNRVLEMNCASLRISQSPVVENLQQHIEHIRMRLLDFVEKDDRVGTTTNSFG